MVEAALSAATEVHLEIPSIAHLSGVLRLKLKRTTLSTVTAGETGPRQIQHVTARSKLMMTAILRAKAIVSIRRQDKARSEHERQDGRRFHGADGRRDM